MQSRLMSSIESVINILFGLFLSWLAWVVLIIPIFKIYPSHTDVLSISCIFTLLSFFRSYIIRRFFNRVNK